MLLGKAILIKYYFNGNKTIVELFYDGDIFGEIFYPNKTNDELFIEAKENCEVLFFTYENILEKCNPKCKFHQELERNLNLLIMNYTINLNRRIEILTKKSTKDKLLAYFKLNSIKNSNRTFTLPLTLTDLADYICVDRSAMTRELTKLKKQGLIEKKGKKITLLK